MRGRREEVVRIGVDLVVYVCVCCPVSVMCLCCVVMFVRWTRVVVVVCCSPFSIPTEVFRAHRRRG